MFYVLPLNIVLLSGSVDWILEVIVGLRKTLKLKIF